MRKIANREYLTSKGFEEDEYGFYKKDFWLMKTTLGIKFEAHFKEQSKMISAVQNEVEEVYSDFTGTKLN